jgi:hypothetical protein
MMAILGSSCRSSSLSARRAATPADSSAIVGNFQLRAVNGARTRHNSYVNNNPRAIKVLSGHLFLTRKSRNSQPGPLRFVGNGML